jgi:hypothetical protein
MSLIERSLKFVIDRTIVRLVRYIKSEVSPPASRFDDAFDIVNQRASATSADYIEDHLSGALLFPTREEVLDLALSKVEGDGIFAEFGVFTGLSINHIARSLNGTGLRVYGFDSFEGLKEDWHGTWFPAGAFGVGARLPEVLPNVTLIKGWFDETLPGFLNDHPDERFAFIHVDSDTFEAATTVLSLLKGRITRGTIIVFDEYLGFPNWRNGEFLAWQNFVKAHSLQYRYLAFSGSPVALMVL